VLDEKFVLPIDVAEDDMSPGGVLSFDGLAGWFDVDFAGSPQNPADSVVQLTTAPDSQGATHWGQQGFFLHPVMAVNSGDEIRGKMHMERNKENHRLMDVLFDFSHVRSQDGQEYVGPPRHAPYCIE
ncbi:class I-like SAM-binding methyltransferase super protein, partial [Cymbomonas tetramitiformis]